MVSLRWLVLAFCILLLAAVALRKLAHRSRRFCCALFLAAGIGIPLIATAAHFIPPAFRPTVRLEALRDGASGDVWLRNVFIDEGKPSFPEVLSGAWSEEYEGLRWSAAPLIEGQTDALALSLPAANIYDFFFYGNRQSGSVRLTYPDGQSEVIDTRQDSADWAPRIVKPSVDVSIYRQRMLWALALAVAGCALLSAALFALLHRLFKRRQESFSRAWAKFSARLHRGTTWPWLAGRDTHPRLLSVTMALVLLLSLVPLLFIARYAHPTYDDYTFGLQSKIAWQATGSVGAVLQAAATTSAVFYRAWQGSFVSNFFMTLQPGVFGERFYVLTPLLMIGMLMLSTWYFARTLLGKKSGSIIALVALFFSIQFVAWPDEAFFWFNGAVYYNFFYSLSLILFALLLRAHHASRPAKRGFYAVGACLAAAMLGAANYATALLSLLLLSLLLGYRCLQKDRRWWIPSAALLCLFITFIISMRSPGNARRQAAAIPMPAFEAILVSFEHAWWFLRDAARLELALGLLMSLPFLCAAARRSGCSFRFPALVSLASFCLFASQFTPHLFATSKIPPPRMLAIFYFSMFWCIGGNVFYWCGWLRKRLPEHIGLRIFSRWVAVAAAALMLSTCAVTATREPDAINGVSAALDLRSGKAQRYGQALAERTAIYEDPSVRDVTLSPLPELPHVLKYTEMVEDPTDWMNAITAEYYGKNTVSVEWPAGHRNALRK